MHWLILFAEHFAFFVLIVAFFKVGTRFLCGKRDVNEIAEADRRESEGSN